MESAEKLIEYFNQFPGIGPRQARRFVYFLLWASPKFSKGLAEEIQRLRNTVASCERCYRFFTKGTSKLCRTCADASREDSVLLVVCRDVDLDAIEKSGAFRGRYFVLGGTIPILEPEPEKKIRARELLRRVREKKELKEIIIATNFTPEGEHTAEYIEKALKEISAGSGIRLSTLGRGLSAGLELEYSDAETLANALKNRSASP